MNTIQKILFWLFLFAFSHANAQWTLQNLGTNLDLTVIRQNAAGSLFVLGNSNANPSQGGVILKSNDAGVTWNEVAHNFSGFSDISFPASGIALAIPKSQDSIFKSFDGGNTWAQSYSLNCNGPFRGFPEVNFTDSLTGYSPGYKTIDGGNTWFSQLPSVQSFPYMPLGITFMNDSTGMIAGYGYWGAMAKTTDRGNTWTWVNCPYNTWEIYSIHFPTEQTGYCTSYKYAALHEAEIIKTTDGGNNWTSIYTTALSSLFYSVFGTDENTCYVVGKNGNISKTTDGGATWNSQYSPTNQILRKVFFANANTGYAVGDSGVMLKTLNAGGMTGISAANSPKKIVSISPNPVSALLKITTTENKPFIVEVYNELGKLILTEKGSYSLELNLKSLPSEVYFLRIKDENGKVLQTEKVVKN